MKNYIQAAAWSIIEEGFDPALHQISESIFSLGNGRMGQRANFEETYSGESLSGNYVAGVYYPDKTRVGWWKNGYPEYFAKVLNSCNWMGLQFDFGGTLLDLHTAEVKSFRRELQMQKGYLQRNFVATIPSGSTVEVQSKRFFSMANDEIAALHYQLKATDFTGTLKLKAVVDGDVSNQDSNYDEKFWDEVGKSRTEKGTFLTLRTKKTGFEVITGVKTIVLLNGKPLELKSSEERNKYISEELAVELQAGDVLDIYKIVTNLSSQNYEAAELSARAEEVLHAATAAGFEKLLAEQAEAWAHKWAEGDIQIEGDTSAQQAIRFNIFQLNQTYTGKDARLNIGPKGFTGEKYGGSTYWDTEAYCIPFYLSTANQEVAKNLLVYRYKHLEKAIENAQKLGFDKGAALYPMVTMNGEECHNEWEITFEEIHRNGAIAFAIYNYVRYTGDQDYLKQYGLEVLIGIARFWKQRVNWSEDKQQYVMLGVTGPNEYENNINNNWYTNTMAVWCLNYAMEATEIVRAEDPARLAEIIEATGLNEAEEFAAWTKIAAGMYLPEDKNLGIFLQQDGYLDKEQILVKDLPASQRPINQKWSWDRILRSGFIKQADVLQGMYFLEDQYDLDALRRNFDFYEARTVHESSLSPCVHSILAAKLNDGARAYEFYLRTARLDLDDYNNDTEDGLHITSMAGTWMSIVEGFAGMRVRNGQLLFRPFLPQEWQSFAFKIGFRGTQFSITIRAGEITIFNAGDQISNISIFDEVYQIPTGETVISYQAAAL